MIVPEPEIIRSHYETSDLLQPYRNGGQFLHAATKLEGGLRVEDAEMLTDAALSFPSTEEVRLHGSNSLSAGSRTAEVYNLNLSRVFVHANSFCRVGTASIDNLNQENGISDRAGRITVCYNFSSRQGYNPSDNVPRFLGVQMDEIPHPVHDAPGSGTTIPYRYRDEIASLTYAGSITAEDAPLVAFRSFQAENHHQDIARSQSSENASFRSDPDRSYSGTKLTSAIGVEFSAVYEQVIDGQSASCRSGQAFMYEPLSREPVRSGPVTMCTITSGPQP